MFRRPPMRRTAGHSRCDDGQRDGVRQQRERVGHSIVSGDDRQPERSIAAAVADESSSAQNPYYGSVTMGTVSPETLQLSLDDAIQRGIQANLALTQARIQQQQSDAQRLLALNPLLPSLKAEASTGAHQYNLETFGFNPGLLAKIAPLFPDTNFANFNPIVKVDVTTADAALNWTTFDLAAITRYRSAKESLRAAYYNTQSSRGLVVLNVGNQYLKTLADHSQIDSADALLRADEVLLKQAQAEHEAGTAARLDELRARVQYQTQQQKVIAAQNAFEKDQILLKREIGVPVEQTIQLTDTAPYADLEQMSIEDARRLAYQSRQDYQGMQRQVRAAQLSRSAAKYERLPTLTAGGNYGVTGLTHGLYHGTFVAMGELQLPIFKEAQFRGDADVAAAQQSDALNPHGGPEAADRSAIARQHAGPEFVTDAGARLAAERGPGDACAVRCERPICRRRG